MTDNSVVHRNQPMKLSHFLFRERILGGGGEQGQVSTNDARINGYPHAKE